MRDALTAAWPASGNGGEASAAEALLQALLPALAALESAVAVQMQRARQGAGQQHRSSPLSNFSLLTSLSPSHGGGAAASAGSASPVLSAVQAALLPTIEHTLAAVAPAADAQASSAGGPMAAALRSLCIQARAACLEESPDAEAADVADAVAAAACRHFQVDRFERLAPAGAERYLENIGNEPAGAGNAPASGLTGAVLYAEALLASVERSHQPAALADLARAAGLNAAASDAVERALSGSDAIASTRFDSAAPGEPAAFGILSMGCHRTCTFPLGASVQDVAAAISAGDGQRAASALVAVLAAHCGLGAAPLHLLQVRPAP